MLKTRLHGGNYNYSTSPSLTGENEAHSVNHIYDLKGNVQEWSLMYRTNGVDYGRVAFGGHAQTTSNKVIEKSDMLSPDYFSKLLGSRITLYLKTEQ